MHVLFYALSLLSRHLKTFDDALRAGCDPCLFFYPQIMRLQIQAVAIIFYNGHVHDRESLFQRYSAGSVRIPDACLGNIINQIRTGNNHAAGETVQVEGDGAS